MMENPAISQQNRQQIRQLPRAELQKLQLKKLNELWTNSVSLNQFYKHKLAPLPDAFESLEQLHDLSLTTKDELLGNSTDQFANNLTYDNSHYTRFHRTSGTKGRPMVVLDTPDDWRWWIDSWQFVLDVAEVGKQDRAVMAFSFGPFIGFWSAYDAAIFRGMMVAPTGGMNTEARLDLIQSINATCIFCTPSYAMRMAEVAKSIGCDLRSTDVKSIIVAGEPGGSIASIRQQIESAWDASVVDHSGASEIGPWGFDAGAGKGLFVNESEFIAEFLSIETGEPAKEGEMAELVLTTLGRYGCPVIRYRTGDLVKPNWNHQQSCNFVRLDGGVLGRVDDMMIVRGVNIFPSSIESILREFEEVIEYQMNAFKNGAMDELKILVECPANLIETISQELYKRLGLRVGVQSAEPNSLPRFDAKGKRFIDHRVQ